MAERQFGPYQLVKQIAVGGMAEIHLAKTKGIAGFEKFCALKMIHPNFAQDEQFIEMLIDEAKIAVQLQHVNIAQTFDLGRVGDTYYITMEFVDGADLYKILRRGSEHDVDFPVDVAAYVAKEMSTGLDYAHRKRDGAGVNLGIVHRDVSPQNVLVSMAGEVKLVDFGIAKATMKVRQTAVGVIKGKYYYMSPEQAWGERLDHRSDIFSAGIVLYEMLTGQMLYLEEDINKLLDMVRRANIAPVRTLRKDVPPQLERIVMHALAKKPEDRYQNAGDFASDLERFLHTYSPVFTATKLAAHLRRALGETGGPAPPPMAVEPEPAPRDPLQSTQSIPRHTFVTNRSEISDENSVIFRVSDLKPGGEGGGAAATPRAEAPRAPTAPLRGPKGPPSVPHVPPRMISAATMQVSDSDLEIESTMVTAEPSAMGAGDGGATSLDGPRGMRRSAVPAMTDDLLGDYEPTIMEDMPGLVPSGQHEDDPVTIARGAAPSAAADDPTTIPQRRNAVAPRTPQPAALVANTPTPHVSEVRKPRESRRTPASGVPIGGSVLQQLVGPPSTPMPRAPAARGAGMPISDGVPGMMPDAQPTGGATSAVAGRGAVPPNVPGARPPTSPLAGMTAGPIDAGYDAPTAPDLAPAPPGPPQMPLPGYPHTPPGMPASPHTPPGMPGLPAHLAPYAMQQTPGQGGYPSAAGAPGGYPFQPYPGAQPQSFTKQMQALVELDEIPSHYKLGSPTKSWLLRALLALVIVAGGVAIALLIVRGSEEGTIAASLLIDSTPSGATVTVDGTVLPDKTPARFETAPGARHEILIELAGFQPHKDAVLVPDGGGQIRVFAFLPAITVKLRVTTVPTGADVYFGEQLKGRTPLEINDLDPASAKEIEVRLKDYPPEKRTLTWDGKTEQTVEIRFKK
ncbi:MAG TPA: protein kinase [Kofleriaceae bacterium]|nr:protein kinase [Kofleriaceae bacterium]